MTNGDDVCVFENRRVGVGVVVAVHVRIAEDDTVKVTDNVSSLDMECVKS